MDRFTDNRDVFMAKIEEVPSNLPCAIRIITGNKIKRIRAGKPPHEDDRDAGFMKPSGVFRIHQSVFTRYEQDSIDTIISQVDEAFVFVFLIFATEVELKGVSGGADIVGDALDELWVIRI
jgi:hypothetical protein